MSPTDQVQELFDRAIASVSHAHHFQLTRCTLASISDGFELGINDWRVSACVAVSASVLVIGLASNTAFAVTLYPYGSGRRARRSFRPINE